MPDAKLRPSIEGTCDARFARVAEVLAEQIDRDEHHGAAVSVRFRGEPVVDIWGGLRTTPDGEAPWQEDTMAICFSTTKGIAATALHMALERTQTSYDTPVADVWPEFGSHGKDAIKIRHLLCHEAGVPQIRDQVDDCWAFTDWDAMVRVMEDLEPIWEPGTANGYHAINYAWLIGETLRRVDGRDIQTFLAQELAGPLELDGLYMGTPEGEHHRIAPLITDGGVSGIAGDEAYDARIPKETVIWKALAPRGSLIDFFNTPDGMAACIPSISGAFTARSLATVYSALADAGEVDGVRLLETETVDALREVQNDRNDLVIFLAPHWRLGFMSGGPSGIPVLGPNPEAFGHVGAGGTFAAADPSAEVSYALVYDRFGPTELLGGARSTAISTAVVEAAQLAR